MEVVDPIPSDNSNKSDERADVVSRLAALCEENADLIRKNIEAGKAELKKQIETLTAEKEEAEERCHTLLAIIRSVPNMEGNTHKFAVPCCSFCTNPVCIQQESERKCPTCEGEIPCLDWCAHGRDKYTNKCADLDCSVDVCAQCWRVCEECSMVFCGECTTETGPQRWRCADCDAGERGYDDGGESPQKRMSV